MKTDLFDLIQSMRKEEKRFFQLNFPKNREEANYMKLFDAIEAQSKYDEAAIKKKFAAEKWTNNFSTAKSYLYEIILQSLENQHKQNTPLRSILSDTMRLNILWNRGLFRAVDNLQKKILRTAEKYFYPLWEIGSYDMQLQILNTRNYENCSQKKLNQIHKAQKNALLASREHLTYRKYQIQIDFWRTKMNPHNQKKYKQYAHKLVQKMLQNSLPINLGTQFLRLSCISQSAEICYKNPNSISLNAAQEALRLLEQHFDIRRSHQNLYLSSLSNIIIDNLDNKNWVLAKANLLKMIDFKPDFSHNPIYEIEHQANIFRAKLRYICNTADVFEDTFLQEVTTFIGKYQQRISKKKYYQILFYQGLIHFYNKNYTECLQIWKPFFESKSELPELNILFTHAYLIRIIIYLESNEILLVPYAVRSLYRALKSVGDLGIFEKLVLNFLQKSISQPFKKTNTVYSNFRKKLANFYEKHPNAPENPSAYFDYLAWLDAYFQKTTIWNILQFQQTL
jgi:hypothetical protein